MGTITDFQRRMWIVLSYLTLCKYYIVRDNAGNFIIKNTGTIRRFFYYTLWINGVIKISYLTMAYRHYLPVEVTFLDQMGMWDWFLTFSQLIQETNMWCRKYPMFEILCANWKIQETVFHRLGSPKHVEDAILRNDRSLVKMHIFIVAGGCIAIIIQFFIAPKYAANIYAVVPVDYWFLRIIFCLHEVCYVYHIWIYEAWSIILCEMYASSYTHIVREMTVTLQKLIDLGQRENLDDLPSVDVGDLRRDASIPFKIKSIWRRKLNPKTKVPGTDYDIMTLLHDYRKMTIGTNSFNSWCGRLMGGTMGSNYSQFVTDVFMMIQLLKEPDTDMLGVAFYAQDACVGMWMIFRMLIIISRLYPASQEFLQALKQYLTFDTPLRPYLLKYQKGMRIIATNLGGYKTKSITVPQGVNALMNWYIAAAMWQRPADRKT